MRYPRPASDLIPAERVTKPSATDIICCLQDRSHGFPEFCMNFNNDDFVKSMISVPPKAGLHPVPVTPWRDHRGVGELRLIPQDFVGKAGPPPRKRVPGFTP